VVASCIVWQVSIQAELCQRACKNHPVGSWLFEYTTDPGGRALAAIRKTAEIPDVNIVLVDLPPMEREVFELLGKAVKPRGGDIALFSIPAEVYD
jgi:hypothetical protein